MAVQAAGAQRREALHRKHAPGAPRDGKAPAPAGPKPDADGVVRSPQAKAAYKAWMKGQMKKFFEDIIATATKKHA